jgi:hypothetical protein
VPVLEDCLGHYIPQIFPLIFIDETLDVGNVCYAGSGGGGGGDGVQCATSSSSSPGFHCTDGPCVCPGASLKKVVHTYGSPAQTCWSCEPSLNGDSYDDDAADGWRGKEQGVTQGPPDAVPVPDPAEIANALRESSSSSSSDEEYASSARADPMQIHAGLPDGGWSPGLLVVTDPSSIDALLAARNRTAGAGAELQQALTNITVSTLLVAGARTRAMHIPTRKAFVPWSVIRHAGWNEPANRYSEHPQYYINLYRPVAGAPTDFAEWIKYAAAHQDEAIR